MKKYRTLIRVVNHTSDLITVVVPGWNSDKRVFLYYWELPENILAQMYIGMRFYGYANLNAENEKEVQLESFEL